MNAEIYVRVIILELWLLWYFIYFLPPCVKINCSFSAQKKDKMSPSTPLLQFINCRILMNHRIVREDLWVRGGKICNPEKLFFDEQVGADIVVDCKNALIAPGFIDVQINGGFLFIYLRMTFWNCEPTGAFGVDFSTESHDLAEGIKRVSKGLLPHGVTSYCPTVITSHPDVYKKVSKDLVYQGGRLVYFPVCRGFTLYTQVNE